MSGLEYNFGGLPFNLQSGLALSNASAQPPFGGWRVGGWGDAPTYAQHVAQVNAQGVAQLVEYDAVLQLHVDRLLQRKGKVGQMDFGKQKARVFRTSDGAFISDHASVADAVKAVQQLVSQNRAEYVIYEAVKVVRPKPIETEEELL